MSETKIIGYSWKMKHESRLVKKWAALNLRSFQKVSGGGGAQIEKSRMINSKLIQNDDLEVKIIKKMNENMKAKMR